MAFDRAATMAQIKAEIAELQRILDSMQGGSTQRRGRPRNTAAQAGVATLPPPRLVKSVRKRKPMSAAARKRLAESAKKRWAAAKKAGKTSL
jgi:hypothetical protein